MDKIGLPMEAEAALSLSTEPGLMSGSPHRDKGMEAAEVVKGMFTMGSGVLSSWKYCHNIYNKRRI